MVRKSQERLVLDQIRAHSKKVAARLEDINRKLDHLIEAEKDRRASDLGDEREMY